MYEQGYYWVRVATFLEWHVAFFNGKYWKLIDDDNEYQNIDLNSIFPKQLLPPV